MRSKNNNNIVIPANPISLECWCAKAIATWLVRNDNNKNNKNTINNNKNNNIVRGRVPITRESIVRLPPQMKQRILNEICNLPLLRPQFLDLLFSVMDGVEEIYIDKTRYFLFYNKLYLLNLMN